MGVSAGVVAGSYLIVVAGVGVGIRVGLCTGAWRGICTLGDVAGVGASDGTVAGVAGVENGGTVARLSIFAIWMCAFDIRSTYVRQGYLVILG